MFADGSPGVGLLLQRLLAGGALAGVLLMVRPGPLMARYLWSY